jgi:hypothetical protein
MVGSFREFVKEVREVKEVKEKEVVEAFTMWPGLTARAQ